MHKTQNTLIKNCKWLLTSMALVLATPSHAEDYIAVDATYMDTKTVFGNGATPFELSPVRIKYGRRYEEFGWEFQALAPSDDTGSFAGSGLTHKYELNGGIGLMITASTPGRGFYGGIGFTQIDSDYSVLVGGIAVAKTGTSVPFLTINFGGQYEFSKNARITLDYTFYHGDIDCNFCTPNPNLPSGYISSDPDVRMSTFGWDLAIHSSIGQL